MLKKTRGFTLVELLVITAILAILAGLLFVVLPMVKAKAQQRVCASNLRQLWTALELYHNDHNSWNPPYLPCTSGCGKVRVFGQPDHTKSYYIQEDSQAYKDALRVYLRSEEVWWCPVDKYRGKQGPRYSQDHSWYSYAPSLLDAYNASEHYGELGHPFSESKEYTENYPEFTEMGWYFQDQQYGDTGHGSYGNFVRVDGSLGARELTITFY